MGCRQCAYMGIFNSFCFNDENTDISRLGANEFEFYTNYVLGFNKKFQLIQKRGDIWPIFLNNSFAQWSLSNL